jgi:hypothetical protein
MKITFPRKKMQTMADRFHDALGSSSVIAENIGALNSLRYKIVVFRYFYAIIEHLNSN